MKQFRQILSLAVALFAASTLSAQVKVGDNPTSINANAVLEVESTNKGLLLPRLALTGTANAAPLSAHVAGMTVYNTATAGDVTPGYYYNDGAKWVRTASGDFWSLNGNAGTNEATNFLGTTDNKDVIFKLNGVPAGRIFKENGITMGVGSYPNATAGGRNVVYGYGSMPNGGALNTVIGGWSLTPVGLANTTVGETVLTDATVADENVGIGREALRFMKKSRNNTAVGSKSMGFQTDSTSYSTGVGFASLPNAGGVFNTGVGAYSGLELNGNSGINYTLLGSNNTFLGGYTRFADRNITNSTAVGVGVVLAKSNTLILGEGADVGIGTNTPGNRLHVFKPGASVNSQLTLEGDNKAGFDLKLSGNTASSFFTFLANDQVGASSPIPDYVLAYNVAAGAPQHAVMQIDGSTNQLDYIADNSTIARLRTNTTNGYLQINGNNGKAGVALGGSNSIISWYNYVNNEIGDATEDYIIYTTGGYGAAVTIDGATAFVGIGTGTVTPTSRLQVVGLPIHADNAAALTAGLTAGAFYHNGDGVVRVVY